MSDLFRVLYQPPPDRRTIRAAAPLPPEGAEIWKQAWDELDAPKGERAGYTSSYDPLKY